MIKPTIKGIPARQFALGKLALTTVEGFELVDIEKIIRCEADVNYTRIFLENREIMIAKPLKEIELKLKDYSFYRVHSHHLVNLKHAVKYVKGKGGQLVLANGTTVEVSSRNKKKLLEVLKNM